MKKLLSILCSVALLISCMAGITVTATEFPHTESFVFDDFVEITDAEWGTDESGSPYVHTITIPLGWEWFYTGDLNGGINWQAQNVEIERQRSRPYLAADEKTYLQRTGGDITVGKIVDIEPGFTYTATANAYTTSVGSGGGRSSIEYFLYHNNGDGTYTPINEYLNSADYEGINANYGSKSLDVYSNGEAIVWNNAAAKTATISVDFTVTNEYANAVMIGFGGFSDNADHMNYATMYDGFEVVQGETVELIPAEKKKNYIYQEVFNNESYEEISFDYDYHNSTNDTTTTYTNTAKIPTGWSWSLNNSNDWNAQAQKCFILPYNNPWKEGYGVYGSWVSLDKIVEVEPGYEYTVITECCTYLQPGVGNNKVNTDVELYHKNDDGTYTFIDSYLEDNNFQYKNLENATTHLTIHRNNYEELTPAVEIKNQMYDATHEVKISITDPNVNAIKIKLGGNNGQGYNNLGIYRSISVTKDDTVEIIANSQPPYLTLENEGKMVRYIPKEVGKTPSIIIAAYAIDSNGAKTLANISITKPEAVNGVYETAYDMDLSDIEGTVTVKALVWDMTKNTPLARSIRIQ